MKKLIFALAFALSPIAVNAGEILPNIYAYKFCEMRAAGLSKNDAMKVAMDAAYVSSTNSRKVFWNGQYVDADVLQTTIAVMKLCPES